MTDYITSDSPEALPPQPTRRISKRTVLIGAALLGLGVAGGAVATQLEGGLRVEMAPVSPVAISALKDDGGVVSVRGRVVEIYGPMFVLADAGGRTLVEAGRQVDGTGLVGPGNAVTVQGHFRHGVLRASFLVTSDGKVTALHPFGPHDGPPRGPEVRGGPRGDRRGPDGPGPDAPDGADAPPPPAGAAASAQAAPAAAAPAAATQR